MRAAEPPHAGDGGRVGGRWARRADVRTPRLMRSVSPLQEHVMRPLRYSINVTLDGCCDHRVMIADGGSVAAAGADGSDPRELALVSTKAASTGVLMNTYRPVGSLRT